MNKLTNFKEQSEKYIKLSCFVLYIGLTLFIGIHHEPWADEAQSWLIARDVPIKELLSVMAYEGSPILWPLVLKFFIFCGLKYQFLFIVPIFFSAVGVWVLIYKAKLPLWVRIMLPFTYYIFYQYTIVARSYCLVLPCLEVIALVHNDKISKPYIYGFLLILLSGISVHMLLLSIVIYLLYCFDVINLFRNKQDNYLLTVNLISIFFVGLSYLLTILYLRTPSDFSYSAAKFNFNITNVLILFIVRIGQALIYNNVSINEFYISIVMIIVIFIIIYYHYKINIKFIIISTTILTFLACFFCNKWHIGLIFLSIIFAFQLYQPTLKQKNMFINKCVYFFVGIILCIQISWSIRTAFYDYKSTYSGANNAAQFIIRNKYYESEIYGLGYFPTAMEPYFKSNIFSNKKNNRAYYIWSFSNGDLTNEEIKNSLPSVIVLSEFEMHKFKNIINTLKLNGYKLYTFEGASYIKDEVYETQTYHIYVRN